MVALNFTEHRGIGFDSQGLEGHIYHGYSYLGRCWIENFRKGGIVDRRFYTASDHGQYTEKSVMDDFGNLIPVD